MLPRDYLPLDRRFARLADDPEAISVLAGGLWASTFGRRYGEDWETLTAQHRFVVVLGEARSGKTYELRARAANLRKNNRFAFYVTLSDISKEGILDALLVEQQHSYQEWLASAEEATILVDSADEARLLQQVRLQDGVRRLRKDLGQAFARTRFVLACRVSDWRPGQDLQELEDALGISSSGEPGTLASPASIHLYQMLPLDTGQITQIAEWKFRDTEDIRNEFLEDLWKSQRWIFAGRPADLIWLIEYYKQRGQFGSFTEITEENIKQKLAEQNPDYHSHALLDSARARDGARRLAAALLLGRKATLSLVGAEQVDGSSQGTEPSLNSVNPGDILIDFRPSEINELLSRPIFDEATYGRVRFHHRTILEYLTADWLKELYRRGCPPAEIFKLLFEEVHGQTVLLRSRAAVAAWLAPSIHEVYLGLQQHAPEALLTQADPAQLTHTEVALGLRTCAQRYRDRRRAYSLLEEGTQTLHQLASLQLEDTVYDLVDQYRNSRDILIFLLKITATAKWASRCALIGDLALSKSCDESVRLWAIRTLAQIDDATQNARLASLARSGATLSSELRGLLCNTLYPDYLSISECLHLLLSWDSANKGRVGSAIESALGYQLPEACLSTDLLIMLQDVLVYIQKLKVTRNTDVLGTSFGWLYHAVTVLLHRNIQAGTGAADIIENLLPAFKFLEVGAIRSKYYDFKTIQAVLREHRSLGRALVLSLYLDRPGWLYIGDFSCMDSKLFTYGLEDIDWLLHQAKKHENPFARRLALFTLIEVWQRVGVDEQTVHEITSLTQDIPAAAPAVQNTLVAKQERPRREAEARERQAREQEERNQREADARQLEDREKSQQAALLQKAESPNLGSHEADGLISRIFDQRINDPQYKILRALLKHQKDRIVAYVRDLIAKEWGAVQRPIPSIVSFIAYCPPSIRKLLGPLILSQVVDGEPKQDEVLKEAFSTIFRDRDLLLDPRLAGIAANRTKSAPTDHLVEWLLVWLILDGRAAWTFLGSHLAEHKEKPAFITRLAASARRHLGDRFLRHHADLQAHEKSFLNIPDLIGRFIKLLYLALPPDVEYDEEDNRMRGVTAAMAAGEFRDGLASYLRRVGTVKAHHVLLELANDPDMLQYRDFLLRLDDLHLVDLAEQQQPNWHTSAINEFARTYVSPPQTDLQLFRLILARLGTIQNAIERGADFSYRELLCRAVYERELQKWIASELHRQSPAFYRVTRESEVEDNKKPDLLILSEECQGRIPIEIKPTDRAAYDYDYYVDQALQRQLIEQYMVDRRTRFGILLLLHTKDRSWKKSGSPDIASFSLLIEELNQVAERLVEARPNIEKIKVLGIDLT